MSAATAYGGEGRYRYWLAREWLGGAAPATFIMLNPSTADDVKDDPTIRRCIGFAKGWGCGGLVVVNLYGLRATNPHDLDHARDPIGPGNDDALRRAAGAALRLGAPLVAAWGASAPPARVSVVLALLGPETRGALRCLARTAKGHPRHPLYVRGDALLSPWSPRGPWHGTRLAGATR